MISREEIPGNIIRLEITLSQENEGKLEENLIRKAASAASYFSITKNVKRQSRPRLGDISVESLSPYAALKMYLDFNRKEYSDEQAGRLLLAGTDIIKQSGDI